MVEPCVPHRAPSMPAPARACVIFALMLAPAVVQAQARLSPAPTSRAFASPAFSSPSFSSPALSSSAHSSPAGASPAAAGSALASSGLASTKARAQLIASGGPAAGKYEAAFDLTLAPGVLTYWRFAGDAGVPPTFDFAGSQNVDHAEVAFPAPHRIVEAGVTTFGYRDEALFPIVVTPKDASRPVVLQANVHYATCDTICVPAESNESITLAPGDGPRPEAARIALWATRVPTPLPAGLALKIVSNPQDGNHQGPRAGWRASFKASDAKTDLFVEGDDGWYFTSRVVAPGEFQIDLVQKPTNASPATRVRLTYVDGAKAFETSMNLDVAGPAR